MEFQGKISKHPIPFKIFSNALSIVFLIIKKIRGKSSNFDPKKIVIISLHKLGDTIFTFPSIKYLKKCYGNRLYIVCFKESVGLYKKLDSELKIIDLKKNDFVLDGRICKNIVRTKINKLKPDLIFDLNGAITSISCLVNIIHCEIYSTTSELFFHFYNKAKLYRNKPHLIDMYFDVVQLKFPDAIPDYSISNPINYSTSDFILIHPFAGWKAKEWNLKNYIRLAKELTKEYKVKIIFERGTISNDIIDDINLQTIVTTSLDDLLQAIDKCSLFIGNDSGPVYISDFLGKPTYSIYGPTNPSFSLPMRDSNKYISSKINCCPSKTQYCFTFGGLFCPSYECMHNLKFQTVLNSVKLFLVELHIKKIN